MWTTTFTFTSAAVLGGPRRRSAITTGSALQRRSFRRWTRGHVRGCDARATLPEQPQLRGIDPVNDGHLVEDGGHDFGAALSDADKHALIESSKTR